MSLRRSLFWRRVQSSWFIIKPRKKMVMPGDTISLKVKLIAPIAMEEKQRFAIREGGKTVGAGVVTKVLV